MLNKTKFQAPKDYTRLSPGMYRTPNGKVVTQQELERLNKGTVGPVTGGGVEKKKKKIPNPLDLPKNVNQGFQTQVQYSNKAADIVNDQLPSYAEPWSPQNIPQAPNPTDFLGDRARIEDELFSRLTKNTERDYLREKERMEQTLSNRGIPLNPADPQYRENMQYLDEKYNGIRSDARSQAVQMGGQEFQRYMDTGRGLSNDAFNRQLGTRQQQFGELGSMADLSGAGFASTLAGKEQMTRDKLAEASIRNMARGGGSPRPLSGQASTTNTAFVNAPYPGL